MAMMRDGGEMFLRAGLAAVLVLCLAACGQTAATPKTNAIWVIEDGRTVVHNPSGMRVPPQAGRFQEDKR